MTWNWKKISIWASAVIIVLVGGAAVTLAALVKQSASFRQGLLADAAIDVYESTGAHVAVRDFSLGFFPLNLDLYGIVVHGDESEFGEPLLRAEHVSAGIELGSLRGRRWRLRDLVLDHPVIHLWVNQSGESNLPQPHGDTKGKSHIFDLAARELRLQGAELICNDRNIPLDTRLRNVHANIDFDAGKKVYRGVLNYSDGNVKFGDYAPVAGSLNLNFHAGAGRFTVDHMELVAGKSRVRLEGLLENYAQPQVQATYEATLANGEAALFLRNVALPVGVVHLAGSVRYRRDPLHAGLATVSLNGTISSLDLAVATSFLQADVHDFGAKYKLADGNADVEDIHAQIFAGQLTGSLQVQDLAGAKTAKLRAKLKDASLQELQNAERQKPSADARLNGKFTADVEADWSRVLQDLTVRASANLSGTLGRNPAAPLRAAFHADYTAASQQLTVHQGYIRTPQTSITLEGSEQSQVQVSLHSGNLHEVELLAENLTSAPLGPTIHGLDLYGTGSFTGSLSGAAEAPRLKGKFEAADLRVKGTRWRLLRTDVDASRTSLTFSNASLEAGSPPEKSQRPEPAAVSTAGSDAQGSQSRTLATVK